MSEMIMVLPGTVWQIPLIKRIKEKGYRIAVVHPYKDAPAFNYADEIVLADILDADKVAAEAKRLGVIALMSDECDIATQTLATVSAELGLPTQGIEMAKLYSDKSLMRDFCATHELPCPKYKVCISLNEAMEFFKTLNGEMIIKPIDANSSRGVFTIHTEEDLKNKFGESISFSHHRKAVICESFISGAEFSVDGIMMPDGHVSLVISEKTQFDYNKNLDNFLFFSHDNPNYDYNKLREINDRFVNLSGLPFGFTHAEYRYENGEYYLLEIGARGGGNLISSHIVPVMTGIDNYSILIKMYTGQKVVEKIVPTSLNTSRVAVLEFFDTTERGGKVKAIHGTDYLKNCPDVLYSQFNFKIGETIKRPTDGGNRIGFYVACCKNRQALEELREEIAKKVLIEYE